MDKHQQTEPSLTNLSFKNALARGVARAYNPSNPSVQETPTGRSVQVQGQLATR